MTANAAFLTGRPDGNVLSGRFFLCLTDLLLSLLSSKKLVL